MGKFSQLNTPQNQESENSDPHNLNVLFLNIHGKSTTSEDHPLKCLYDLEEPPETSDGERLMDYIKKIILCVQPGRQLLDIQLGCGGIGPVTGR